MTFLELVKQRRSVRQYSTQEVESQKLDYILECARMAPSAANFQPWKFFIVKDEETQQLLQKVYPREWFATAPLYIVACGNREQSWKRAGDEYDHTDIDVAIAVDHLSLAAAEQGLGTCWVCNFDTDACKRYLEIDDPYYPVAIIPIGYPASDEAKKTPRKSIDELVKTIG